MPRDIWVLVERDVRIQRYIWVELRVQELSNERFEAGLTNLDSEVRDGMLGN